MTDLLNKAVAAYAVSDMIPRPERIALAKELGEFGLLSKRQIAAIVRVDVTELTTVFEKKDSRGGKLNPKTLPLIASAMTKDGHDRLDLLLEAYEMGTGIGTIVTLTGESRDKLWRRLRANRRASDD